MKAVARLGAFSMLLVASYAFSQGAGPIDAAIGNDNRPESNTERDGARKPSQVLEFMALQSGDVVLDYGAGGGYWAELFSSVVGPDGKVYAHQNAGERYDSNEAAWTEQFAPFGNIELLPVERGSALPLDDDSVDAVMVSYLFHHMHYTEDSGEGIPDSSKALFAEFRRVLKPGGSLLIIEHAAADGSSRAESGGWHRTPPETAKSDLASYGFEFAGEAPQIYFNPDDDRMNVWYETGLQGKTTSFVHKYRKPM